MKKIKLIILFLILAFTILPLFSNVKAKVSTKEELKNYLTEGISYQKVEVDNVDSLRTVLLSTVRYYIVITADITLESEIGEGINNFEINGSKIVELNGHKLYFSDNIHIKKAFYFYIDTDENEYISYYREKYDRTLFTVKYGADLKILDSSSKGTGEIQYDALISDYETCKGVINRNLFEIKSGANLEIYGGKYIAGRVKYTYNSITDQTKGGLYRYRYCNVYNCGAAFIVDGGSLKFADGIAIGHGNNEQYGINDDEFALRCQHGAIIYRRGSLLIENGSFYGYGRNCPALGILWPNPDKKSTLKELDIQIKGGYFESKCPEYSATYNLYVKEPHSVAIASMYIDINHYVQIDKIEEDVYGSYINVKETTINTKSECDGSDAGDSSRETINFKRNDNLKKDVLSAGFDWIYQYVDLNIDVLYEQEAYHPVYNYMMASDVVKEVKGAKYNTDDFRVSVRLVINKVDQNGDETYFREIYYKSDFSEFVDGKLTLKVKNYNEKWDVGKYSMTATIYEAFKSPIQSETTTMKTNSIKIEIKDAKEMFDVVHNAPEVGPSIAKGSTKVIDFSLDTKATLKGGMSYKRVLMVKGPNDNAYNEVAPINGDFKLNFDTTGNYYLMEIGQIVDSSGNVLVQKSNHLKFMAVPYKYNLTKEIILEGVEGSKFGGTVLMTNKGVNAPTKLANGEIVYLEATPNENSRFVRFEVKTVSGKDVSIIGMNSSFQFEMPDEDVVVKAYFTERLYTINYLGLDGGIYKQVKWDSKQNYIIEASDEVKMGCHFARYHNISDNEEKYYEDDIYVVHADITLVPEFDENVFEVKYQKYGGSQYYIDYVSYSEGLNYVLLSSRDEEIDALFNYANQFVAAWTSSEDGNYYKPHDIYPISNDVTFSAIAFPTSTISEISLRLNDGNYKLQFGDNNVRYEAYIASFGQIEYQVNFIYDNVHTEVILTDSDPIIIEANTTNVRYLKLELNDQYVFPDIDKITVLFDDFDDYCQNEYIFADKPLLEVVSVSEDNRTAIISVTLYPSCGPEKEDHDFAPIDGEGTHWCIDDNIVSYICLDCYLYHEEIIEKPEELKINELHTLVLVPEVEGDCANGVYGIYSHYECEACGAIYTKHGLGDNAVYEEKSIDDFKYLHQMIMQPGKYEFAGEMYDVHYEKCFNCGLIDEDTIGFHKNEENGYGPCDVCLSYIIPCEHIWEEVVENRVEPTCISDGIYTMKCSNCGDEIDYITPRLDHELVYVEEKPSTCHTHGVDAYYYCSSCGSMFDADINALINAVDPEGIRFVDLDKKYEAELEALGYNYDDLRITNVQFAIDENIQNSVHNVILNHQINNIPVKAELDPTNHEGPNEVRDALAVSMKVDGYTGDEYCTVCDTKLVTGEVIKAHQHQYNGVPTEYKTDANYHWHECNAYLGNDGSVCDEILDKDSHQFGEWVTNIGPNSISRAKECAVCGYVLLDEDYKPEPELINEINTYVVMCGENEAASEQGINATAIFALAKEKNSQIIITLGDVEIIFDRDAVASLSGDINFKFSLSEDNLDIENAKFVIEVSLNSVFTGKVKIRVNYDKANLGGKDAKIYFINGDNREEMPTTISDNFVEFETTHFSKFALIAEGGEEQGGDNPGENPGENPENPGENPENPENPGENPVNPNNNGNESKGLGVGAIIGIVLGSLVLVGGIVFLVLFLLKKKKKA